MVAVTVKQTSYTKYRALKLPQKRNKIEFLKTLRLFTEIRIPIDVIASLLQLIICIYTGCAKKKVNPITRSEITGYYVNDGESKSEQRADLLRFLKKGAHQ